MCDCGRPARRRAVDGGTGPSGPGRGRRSTVAVPAFSSSAPSHPCAALKSAFRQYVSTGFPHAAQQSRSLGVMERFDPRTFSERLRVPPRGFFSGEAFQTPEGRKSAHATCLFRATNRCVGYETTTSRDAPSAPAHLHRSLHRRGHRPPRPDGPGLSARLQQPRRMGRPRPRSGHRTESVARGASCPTRDSAAGHRRHSARPTRPRRLLTAPRSHSAVEPHSALEPHSAVERTQLLSRTTRQRPPW
jgi:hypothetical protein